MLRAGCVPATMLYVTNIAANKKQVPALTELPVLADKPSVHIYQVTK